MIIDDKLTVIFVEKIRRKAVLSKKNITFVAL